MAVSWRITVFQKLVCWDPYFYSVLGVRAFWAKLSKKGNFWTPPKKRKFWLIIEKLFFWYFCVFYFLFLLFCFFLVCFFCFFVSCLVCFFGGFKGQVRWPKGPPHLALNHPYLFIYVFVFFVPFLSLLLIKKPCFPPKKGIFLCFLWFSFFLPQPFLAFHLFNFSFSVSLCLSLSLSLSFFSFFLPSCLSFFTFFWFLLFLSFSFFFLLCFCFLKRTTWNF